MPDFQGERITVSPRRDFRERRKARAEGRPVDARPGDPPPGLLGGDFPSRPPVRQIRELADPEGPDPAHEILVLRARPGHRRNARARVRVYHLLPDRRLADEDARCWAFTISRRAWARLVTERVLDSDGATYPDGRAVVPEDSDPSDVPVRCGSCGTTSVECLQMLFYEN